MNRNCEPAPEYPADAYVVRGHSGITWYVLGWETLPDRDTPWSGYENRTGNLLLVMVGDDHRWIIDPSDVSPIEGGHCHECGQLGCYRAVYSDT